MQRRLILGGLSAGILVMGLSAFGSIRSTGARAMAQSATGAKPPELSIGGEPVVSLVRQQGTDKSKPQFLEATVLPGHGMNLLQLKAWIPGVGEKDLIASPSVADAIKTLESDDEFGNHSFMMGGAVLLPYPNRIRGTLSADGKTIQTTIDGHAVSLPANWHGKNPGAEVHAMHGLIMSSRFTDVQDHSGPPGSFVTAELHAGNFGGHWFSKTDVSVHYTLTDKALDMEVTAKNVGTESEPMSIGFHPYFAFPVGDRQQARLRIPADMRAPANNLDDVFPTGQIVPVKGTPYDFTARRGAALGTLFMDESFTHIQRNAAGTASVEISDPAADYGMRITMLSKEIKAIQVYAPPDKQFVAVEPQFNLADPFNAKLWGKADTGMVTLAPGKSVTWHIRLELFLPNDEPNGTPMAPAKR